MRADRSNTWPLRYNVLWQSGGKEFSHEFTYEGWALKFAEKKKAKGAVNVRIYDKVDLEMRMLVDIKLYLRNL